MWCPRCEQGNVEKVKIIKTNEVVHLCDECDALWPNGKSVESKGFIDFATYVGEFGLQGLWEEVLILNG